MRGVTMRKTAIENTVCFPMIENGKEVWRTKDIEELTPGERLYLVNIAQKPQN